MRVASSANSSTAPPASCAGNASPAGRAPAYFRWHGSPRIYFDAYPAASLAGLASRLRGRRGAWVIFDNTAHGHATADALALRALLARER